MKSISFCVVGFLLVLTLALPVSLYGAGQNVVPYTNSFESYPVGYAISNDTGWYLEWPGWEAVITNVPDHGMKTPYLDQATHSNVLDVAGAVSNAFNRELGLGFVRVDTLLCPQYRDDFPDFSDTPAMEDDPQVCMFVNSSSNLVFFHTWYDVTNGVPERSSYRPGWTTNTAYSIPSNEWMRLTVTMCYSNSWSAIWGCFFTWEAFYSIQINGGPLLYSDNGYPEPALAGELYPGGPPGGTWFLLGTTPYLLSEEGQGLGLLAIEGHGQVDDLTVTRDAPPGVYIADAEAVAEGDAPGATTAVFVVSCPLSSFDTYAWFESSNNTATAPDDFVQTNGLLIIPAGSTTGTIAVVINGDDANESTESFYVCITDSSNATISRAMGQCDITDDDEPILYTSHLTPHSWLDGYGLVIGGNYEAADTNDYDNDGALAFAEYWAGTDPTESNSVFKIVSVGTDFSLTFLGGTNEVNPDFVIFRATNLLTLNPWSYLPSTNYPRQGSNHGTNTWVDPDGPTFAPKVFYKITAPTNNPAP